MSNARKTVIIMLMILRLLTGNVISHAQSTGYIPQDRIKKVQQDFRIIKAEISNITRGFITKDVSSRKLESVLQSINKLKEDIKKRLDTGNVYSNPDKLILQAIQDFSKDPKTAAVLIERLRDQRIAAFEADLKQIDAILDLFTRVYYFEINEDDLRAGIKRYELGADFSDFLQQYNRYFSRALDNLDDFTKNVDKYASQETGNSFVSMTTVINQEFRSLLLELVVYLVDELVWDVEKINGIISKEGQQVHKREWKNFLESYIIPRLEIIKVPGITASLNKVESMIR